nr:hypothetical protein [uncultured Bifidobacterium sp.]
MRKARGRCAVTVFAVAAAGRPIWLNFVDTLAAGDEGRETGISDGLRTALRYEPEDIRARDGGILRGAAASGAALRVARPVFGEKLGGVRLPLSAALVLALALAFGWGPSTLFPMTGRRSDGACPD